MPNGNLKHSVQCPNCGDFRLVRSDVLRLVKNKGAPLICKPCHNRIRFAEKPHPLKGTGVKNNENLLRTRSSYYKAKYRCKVGKKHHACYEKVLFKFNSLQELIDCIGIRPVGCSIDRIDPLGHYEAGNVRWATFQQQTENRLPRNYWKNKDS